jgi:hypothetical protein
MSALNAIRSLIASMKPEEIKVARNFLKAFSTRGTESRNLSLELFDLLLNEKKTSEVVASDKIEFFLYGNYHNAGYVSLVIRLLEKIEESLLLEVNLNRKGNHSEQARELYNVRKQISLAQIIYYRGCVDHSITLFQSALKTSDKFEFFEEYAVAARYYMQVLLYKESIKEYQNIKNKYDKAIRAIQGIKKAEYYYNQLSFQLQFSSVGAGVSSLEKQIAELQFELTQTRTATVAYYLTFIETQYYQELKKYKLSAQTLKEQIRLIEHPALYSDNAKGLSLLNLGWNEIYMQHLKQAEKNILNAKQYFKSETHVAVSQCHLALFYIYFYLGNSEKALNELDIIDTNESTEKINSFKKGKIDFLRAATFFINKQFEETKRILRDLNPIESDSEGWNIQFRVLHIINDIELGVFENAFNRIENLRKHIDKLNRKAEQSQRVLIIFDILRTLGNANFDFQKTRQKKLSELSDLQSQINAWEILSPELIIFDQWFESKVFKKNYQHLIQQQRSKI